MWSLFFSKILFWWDSSHKKISATSTWNIRTIQVVIFKHVRTGNFHVTFWRTDIETKLQPLCNWSPSASTHDAAASTRTMSSACLQALGADLTFQHIWKAFDYSSSAKACEATELEMWCVPNQHLTGTGCLSLSLMFHLKSRSIGEFRENNRISFVSREPE